MKPTFADMFNDKFMTTLDWVGMKSGAMQGGILSVNITPNHSGNTVQLHLETEAFFHAWDNFKEEGDIYGSAHRSDKGKPDKEYPYEINFQHGRVRMFTIGNAETLRPWLDARGCAGLLNVIPLGLEKIIVAPEV